MEKLHDILKKAELMPVYKKDDMLTNKTIIRLVHCPIYQKYLKNSFTLKLIHILVINSLKI